MCDNLNSAPTTKKQQIKSLKKENKALQKEVDELYEESSKQRRQNRQWIKAGFVVLSLFIASKAAN